MLAIPSGHTQTGAVLALAVLVAAGVAKFRVAEFSAPALVTLAGLAHTPSVLAALQVAELCLRESKRTVPLATRSQIGFPGI